MLTSKTRAALFLQIFQTNLAVNIIKVQRTSFHVHITFYYKSKNKMLLNSNLLKPPKQVKEMQILDKTKFNREINVPFIKVDNQIVSKVLPCLKKYLLKLVNFKPVLKENNTSVIHLNPIIITKWDDIEEADRKILSECDKTGLENKSVTLTYDNFTVEDVFRAVLPKDREGVASFTSMGHIVHVNLREHLIPYKKLIGEVLYDKIPGCKTVVNKIDIIDNTYRNFQMEILKGENNFMVKLKENKCCFEFDFSKVYWNSRLCTEHERIVNILKPNDVLFDVFAGVGPFSIPVGKKGATVFGNDLNPESFKWLEHNIKINKLRNNISVYNIDGREFITSVIKENLFKFTDKNIYIVMNLPALSIDFLDAFIGLYDINELIGLTKWPVVYVYCFTKGEDCVALAKDLVIGKMGDVVKDKIIDIFKVRTVSSMKEMVRIAFSLDADILAGGFKRKMDENTVNFNSKKICHGKEQGKEAQQCIQSSRSEES